MNDIIFKGCINADDSFIFMLYTLLHFDVLENLKEDFLEKYKDDDNYREAFFVAEYIPMQKGDYPSPNIEAEPYFDIIELRKIRG